MSSAIDIAKTCMTMVFNASIHPLVYFWMLIVATWESYGQHLLVVPLIPIREISLACFVILFALKYTKTIVGCFTYATFKPRPVKENPKYTSKDVSVVIPTTFKEPHALLECVTRILKTDPARIFIVTLNSKVVDCKKLLHDIPLGQIEVLGVAALNKRVQILTALDHVTTDIIVLADDDVFWPTSDYLKLLLAVFEDDAVGAGGTRQRVRRDQIPGLANIVHNTWNFLGIGYLERRTWNNATTNAIDGSISTLSGRTAAYRAEILQTAEFRHYFLNDAWRNKPLNSDDDKCLTRYVYSNNWKIAIQFDPRAVLETTVETGPEYLNQCMRWARAHWRGNFTVMENESFWKARKMLWGFYVIYMGSFLTPCFLWEGLLAYFLCGSFKGGRSDWSAAACIFVAWVLATKITKYIPHFLRHPTDIVHIPSAILFSYFHGLKNIQALCTMTHTGWGTHGVGTASHAAVAMAQEKAMHVPDFTTPGHGERFSRNGSHHIMAKAQAGTVVRSTQSSAEMQLRLQQIKPWTDFAVKEAARIEDCRPEYLQRILVKRPGIKKGKDVKRVKRMDSSLRGMNQWVKPANY